MFFKLSSHDYSKEYTQNKIDQFTYSKSPNAVNNEILSNPLSKLEISLRFLLTLVIIEMASLAALIPFSIISMIGVGLWVVIGVTSLLVLINYLSLMVVAPGSIPTFRWIKNITQYGRLNRMNQEEYVSERELKRVKHIVERGYFTIGSLNSCVSIHRTLEPSDKWVIYVPGAGSHPGDYTDTKSAATDTSMLFGHHNIIIINRPKASVLQRWFGTYNAQTPMDTVKAAFLYVNKHQPKEIIWYGHCMGGPIMTTAIDAIKAEYPKQYQRTKHKHILDRTFKSVFSIIRSKGLPGIITFMTNYDYRIPLFTLTQPTLIIDGNHDEIISPKTRLGFQKNEHPHHQLTVLKAPLAHNDLLSSLNEQGDKNTLIKIQSFINKPQNQHTTGYHAHIPQEKTHIPRSFCDYIMCRTSKKQSNTPSQSF